jgi:hypothetical protein
MQIEGVRSNICVLIENRRVPFVIFLGDMIPSKGG